MAFTFETVDRKTIYLFLQKAQRDSYFLNNFPRFWNDENHDKKSHKRKEWSELATTEFHTHSVLLSCWILYKFATRRRRRCVSCKRWKQSYSAAILRKNYNVGKELLVRVAILGDKGKVFIVFMMHLVIFIQTRNFMKGPMDKHVQNIIGIHDDWEVFEDLQVSWKAIEPKTDPTDHYSQNNKKGINHPVVNDQIFNSRPLYFFPVCSFPVGFQLRFDLIFFICLSP